MQFLQVFNGRAFFLSDRWETSSSLDLYTDAAASKGYGAIFGQHWFFGSFPEKWNGLNITVLELFPITIAVHIWGSEMANRCIVFHTDNAALVDIINKQTSRHKAVMILIRDLVLSCLRYNILFRAKHVPGLYNTRADYISRLISGREIQANHARCGRVPNTSPVGPSSGELVAHLRGLMGSALTSSSRKSYQRAWRVFQIFHQRFYKSSDFRLPLSSPQIALFISHLSASNLAPSTITSYLSAISYVHKIKGLQDRTKSFLILKLLTALGRQRSTDVRLPITRPVLHELVGSLRYTNSSAFQRSLYSTMFW